MMQIIKYPSGEQLAGLLERPATDYEALFDSVRTVLTDVKTNGDTALRKWTKQFDGVAPEHLEVTPQEIAEAATQIPNELKQAIEMARRNIWKFHSQQQQQYAEVETSPGVYCWQKAVPIERVGLYIPGGSAPLFSTVLMLGIPAKIAECQEVILCSPPDSTGRIHPAVIYAAGVAGVHRIFKVGGAQAIGAMAYGTETIPRVHKIFGPGNRYVTAAKQLVSLADVAIDMPAGPSEVEVLADETANPAFVAADLLSQAEHGPDSQVMLVTTSEELIAPTLEQLHTQLQQLPRKTIAEQALANSKVILVKNLQEAIRLTNTYAPEHLIISTRGCTVVAEHIVNAGSVFLGNTTPESAGDYASGTNHTLPTHGYARAYSGVSLDAFMKKITFQHITHEGLTNLSNAIVLMAEHEGLHAHANAVKVRLARD